MPTPGCRTCSPWVDGHAAPPGSVRHTAHTDDEPQLACSARTGGRPTGRITLPLRTSSRLTRRRRATNQRRAMARTPTPSRCRSAISSRSASDRVPARRRRRLARDPPAGQLPPTPPGSPIHTNSVTGRLQGNSHGPAPPRTRPAYRSIPSSTTYTTPRIKTVLRRPIELALPMSDYTLQGQLPPRRRITSHQASRLQPRRCRDRAPSPRDRY